MGPFKMKLLGSVRTIAIGLVIGAAAPSLANAALTCSPGTNLGAGSCTESISFGPALTDLTSVAMTLDKWHRA